MLSLQKSHHPMVTSWLDTSTKEPWWLRSFYGCSPVADGVDGLEFWISGPAARAMESCSDAEVMAALHQLLARRLRREALPEPNGLVRSRWSNVVKLKVDYDIFYLYLYQYLYIYIHNMHNFPCVYVYIYHIYIIEGSLEVKLPTIYGQMKSRAGKRQREEED